MIKRIFPIAAAVLLFAGCSAEYIATMPSEDVIVRTDSPGPTWSWVDPEYKWDGTTYVVVPGHWIQRQNAVWIRGHWKETNRGYRWIPGHWQ